MLLRRWNSPPCRTAFCRTAFSCRWRLEEARFVTTTTRSGPTFTMGGRHCSIPVREGGFRCTRSSAPAWPPRSLLFCPFPPMPPTSHSSATISPTARSGSKRRSRTTPAPSPSLRRRCGARPMPRFSATTSAAACSPCRRSSRSRRKMQRTGCGSPAPSCRFARPTIASAPRCSSARRRPPTSPISAPAVAARRPTRSSFSAAPSPSASCGGRRSTPCGSRSTCARSPTCAGPTSACATTTASACSTTRSMPTPRRRAPASSSPKACPAAAPIFSPFVTVAGQDKPALSADDKQLCVEGLKHGERYTITLRAGLPSLVKETLAKSADFNIYVRDRKPFVRFTGKAYVLPRTGQRGIPVVSVNTPAVAIADLSHRRPQPARHRGRQRFPAQSRPLRARAHRRPARRQRVEGRAEGRIAAQCRRHHRVPGRPGGRRSRRPASTSCRRSRRAASAERLRFARHPVVHRLRSRPHRLFRQ